MLFNSLAFALFACLVMLGHRLLRRSWSGQKLWLLLASWIFYASWSPRFLPLLVATTWLDFHLARLIHRWRWEAGRPSRARALMITSLAMNLGVLAFFKYGRFFWESGRTALPLGATPSWLDVAAPLGVSFYTFHSISYIVDTYRGLRPPTNVFSDFALYVAFFPQLIAGPITRWGFFGPQLRAAPRVGLDEIEQAAVWLARGLVKKVVFADAFGLYVDAIYQTTGPVGWLEAWVILYAYAFQIYFDFSGYTDIAQGVARLFGLRLPPNFDRPYRATDPSEFWRRWHISLSSWLRDYLYVSLGGNRRGVGRTYANLMLTMLLGGLWHGAAWTFVMWGAFHGAWLALHRWLTRDSRQAPQSPEVVRRLATFHLVALAWILFRAGTVANAGRIMRGFGNPSALYAPFPTGTVALLAIAIGGMWLGAHFDLSAQWRKLPAFAHGMVYAAIVLTVGLFSASSGGFIYFQF